MNSNIDFQTATDNVLSGELDKIIFSGLTQGDGVALTFTVYGGDGNTQMDSWTTTYHADSDGVVAVYGMKSVWNRYLLAWARRYGGEEQYYNRPAHIPEGITVEITYKLDDDTTDTYQRSIYYSHGDIYGLRGGVNDVLEGNKAPYTNNIKTTFTGGVEWFNILGSAYTMKVDAKYLQSGAVSTATYTITGTVGTWGKWCDVSPSAISSLIPVGATLLEWTAKAMSGDTTKCSVKYVMNRKHYAKKVEIAYLNKCGVYETLWLNGGETTTTEREAEFGWSGNEWAAIDLDTTETHEASTGRMGNSLLEQVRDLADTPSAWFWDMDRNTWRKITVLGMEVIRRRPSNEAHVCRVRYRFSERT